MAKKQLYESILLLSDWLERNDYRGYDTFDGLSTPLLRPLTFDKPLLRIALQQAVRRFPINMRPLLGIPVSRSTKGMGFLARGFIRLYEATGDTAWQNKADSAFQWLLQNVSGGYAGACWGNHFDYQSRTGYAPKGLPSVVWTSLVGHAFLDAYDHYQEQGFLDTAISSCEHILTDLGAFSEGNDSVCIRYFPGSPSKVHNANTLGASLLARTYSYTKHEPFRAEAEKSIRYTARSQRDDASWYYGEAPNLHWVDNFHTAYVLDCFKYYEQGTGDRQFNKHLMTGYQYWKNTFFLEDGTPKYYSQKTLPLDIQCCSQAIDTLMFFRDLDPEAPRLALKVAQWTIKNMQDKTGYFYYRRYSRWIVNKTPTLHWGQATMLSALASLYQHI
jgi:rhamnogalacturonyl hydrolase YesR